MNLTEIVRIPTFIIAAEPGHARLAALAVVLARIPVSAKISIILEGWRAGESEETLAHIQESTGHTDIQLQRLAAACMCCTGALVLRVTLARVLRLEQPQYLVLGMGETTDEAQHRGRLQTFLTAPPYGERLILMGHSGLESCRTGPKIAFVPM